MANNDAYPFQSIIEETHRLVDEDRKRRGLQGWNWELRNNKPEYRDAFRNRIRKLLGGIIKI